MHFSAAAAMTPSGVPPIPNSTSTPASGHAVAIAPKMSPSPISLMRAPLARTSAMSSSWRGRSRITTVRSRTLSRLALAIHRRFWVVLAVMSIEPTASGPTAIFSM